jgi:hypothetical protein
MRRIESMPVYQAVQGRDVVRRVFVVVIEKADQRLAYPAYRRIRKLAILGEEAPWYGSLSSLCQSTLSAHPTRFASRRNESAYSERTQCRRRGAPTWDATLAMQRASSRGRSTEKVSTQISATDPGTLPPD